MATTQKIISDLGSEEVRLLRLQYNVLLKVVEDLLAAIAASSDYATLKTGSAAVVVTALRKLVAGLELPAQPAGPAV